MTDGAAPSGPARPPDARARYGGHPDQVADVYLPAPLAEPAPVVMALHGGFWRQAYDRSHLAPFAEAVAASGHVVVSVEYRRVGGDGGWPATFDDVAAACTQLPALVADVAPVAVALRDDGTPRVVLVGHSAGGHLALWAATSCPPRGLDAVVALAPVADLATAWRLGLSDDAVGALLGGPPSRWPERYAAADPSALPAPRVSTTVVHGRADDVVPLDISRRYVDAVAGGRAAGGRGTVDLVEADCGHFELIDPSSTPIFTLIMEKLRSR